MAEHELHPIEAAEKQRRLMLRLVRMGFFIILFTVALLTFLQELEVTQDDPRAMLAPSLRWYLPLLIASLLSGVAVLVDVLTPRKKISSISGVFLGILGGLLATVALAAVMDLMVKAWFDEQVIKILTPIMTTIKVMLGITMCYLGVSTVLQTQDDFRLVIPYVEFAKQIRGPRPLILDTSALIDARIAEVGATGILQAPLIIPQYVVAELQLLADSSDRLKRAKGRRGLDVISRLQRGVLDVSIDDSAVPGQAVDQMLVEQARLMPGIIVTTDTGLERVARIQGVGVLNLNELAGAFRPALIPGERLTLRLVKPGEQAGQAVGYLEDGTMVVAENGAQRLGLETPLIVTSNLQTSAGRLVFAKVAPPSPDDAAPESEHANAEDGAEHRAAVHAAASAPDAREAGASPRVEAAAEQAPAAPKSEPAPPVKGGPFPPQRADRRPPTPRNPRRM